MADDMNVNRNCDLVSTMIQLVNQTYSSFTSDQVTTGVEGSGCPAKNIPCYPDGECNASSLLIDAGISSKVIITVNFVISFDII